MKRAYAVVPLAALFSSANAQGKQADERFFDAFLPLMIGVGVVIVLVVVVANVVATRRRMLRAVAPPFDQTFGPAVPPRKVSKTTTTTSPDGSVTVTVIEETSVSGGAPFGINGVVDPELFGGNAVNGALEQEILTEVRDAFRRMGGPPNDVR